jgi:hypothetical protein
MSWRYCSLTLLHPDFITSYNVFAFDPNTTVTTALKNGLVETSDGRSIAYNEITLGLRTTICGQPTDSYA